MKSHMQAVRLNVSLVIVVLSLAAASRHAEAATLYTLNATHDNAILAGAATSNFGGIDQIQTGKSASADTRSIIRFDMSSLAGVLNGTNYVSSVTMRLYLKSFESTELKTTQVYSISPANAVWAEGTSNWNNRVTSPTTAWTGGAGLATAGTAYDSFLYSTKSYTNLTAPAVNSAIDFAFSGSDLQKTNLIMSWADTANSGLLLLDPNGGTLPGTLNRILYHSSEVATVGFRPQLFVTVDILPVPEPSSALLLAGGLALISARARRKRGQLASARA